MIVRDDGTRLTLITQPDHAALSGRLMTAWRADGLDRDARRPTILRATRDHDIGWDEVDAHPGVDAASGHPYDFLHAPTSVKQAIWPRAVARLRPDDPEAAALVAQHALTVLTATEDASWRDFFGVMAGLRDELLMDGAFDGGLPVLMEAYRFVFIGDLLSLVLCCGWTRRFEAHGYMVKLDGGTLRVTPDPFGGGVVPVSVPVRRIPRRRYDSPLDLDETLAGVAVETWTGTVVGADGPGALDSGPDL